MAIFSSIRKSRQRAKDEDARVAEQQRKESEKAPYRHVPTHAAVDAFASAPPRWREAADRARIIEQNQRRSTLLASSSQLSLPTTTAPRIGSNLSQVSFPGSAMGSKGRVPRSYSYAGVSPYRDGSRDIIYSIPDDSHLRSPPGREQWPPESTTSESTSSQDELEIGSVSRAPVSSATSSTERSHRLHPSSRANRKSDTSLDRRIPSSQANHSIAGRLSPSPNSLLSAAAPTMPTPAYNALPIEENTVALQSDDPTAYNATPSLDGQLQESTKPLQTNGPSSPLALSTTISNVETEKPEEEFYVPNYSYSPPHPGTPVHEADMSLKFETETESRAPKPMVESRPQKSHDVTPWEDSSESMSSESKVDAGDAPEGEVSVPADSSASSSEKSMEKPKKSTKRGGKLLRKNRQ